MIAAVKSDRPAARALGWDADTRALLRPSPGTRPPLAASVVEANQRSSMPPPGAPKA